MHPRNVGFQGLEPGCPSLLIFCAQVRTGASKACSFAHLAMIVGRADSDATGDGCEPVPSRCDSAEHDRKSNAKAIAAFDLASRMIASSHTKPILPAWTAGRSDVDLRLTRILFFRNNLSRADLSNSGEREARRRLHGSLNDTGINPMLRRPRARLFRCGMRAGQSTPEVTMSPQFQRRDDSSPSNARCPPSEDRARLRCPNAEVISVAMRLELLSRPCKPHRRRLSCLRGQCAITER
jgi:hypothetical protein